MPVTTHGSRKTAEKSTFDGAKGMLTRETSKGGKSESSIGACAKDALAFLFFARKELTQGRVPGPETVYFGSPYRVKLQYAGTESLTLGDTRIEVDRITAGAKGPASDIAFDLYFARDATRTPVLIKAPMAMGTFSMELVR